MLTFNLKKEWFEKIKSGEKTHEYREIKPYWEKRLENEVGTVFPNTYYQEYERYYEYQIPKICEFVCGYAKKDDKEKRIKAKIKSLNRINGKNTDLKIDKEVYDVEFEVIDN